MVAVDRKILNYRLHLYPATITDSVNVIGIEVYLIYGCETFLGSHSGAVDD
jgi:hypothetical protein